MRLIVRTAVGALLGALAVAVVTLPAPPEPPLALHGDKFSRDIELASRHFGIQSELLRRAHSLEAARTVAAIDAQQPSSALAAAYVPLQGHAGLDAFVKSVQKVSESLPIRDTSIRFVFTAVLDTGATLAGAPVPETGGDLSADAFPPGSVSPKTCITVYRVMSPTLLGQPRRGTARARNAIDPVGPCWWFGAFGIPGRGVASWLDSTRHSALAISGAYRMGFAHWELRSDVRDEWVRLPTMCRARVAGACAALLLGGRIQADGIDSPNQITSGRRYPGTYPDARATTILHAMIAEFGADRFAQFWKSNADVPDAFAAVSGQSLDAWIHAKVIQEVSPYNAGPAPSSETSLAIAAFVPLFLLIGFKAVTRRTGIA